MIYGYLRHVAFATSYFDPDVVVKPLILAAWHSNRPRFLPLCLERAKNNAFVTIPSLLQAGWQPEWPAGMGFHVAPLGCVDVLTCVDIHLKLGMRESWYLGLFHPPPDFGGTLDSGACSGSESRRCGGWLKPGRAKGRFLGITETYCVQFVRFDSNCKTVLAVRDSSSVPLCPTEPYSLYLWMRWSLRCIDLNISQLTAAMAMIIWYDHSMICPLWTFPPIMPQCHASGAKVSKDTPEDQGPGGSKLRTLAVDLGELAGFILLVQNSHLARFAKWLVPAPSHVHWNSIHDFGEFFHFLAKSFLGNQRPSTTFKAWHDFTGFASGKGEIPQELGRTACSTSTQEHYILKNLQLAAASTRAACIVLDICLSLGHLFPRNFNAFTTQRQFFTEWVRSEATSSRPACVAQSSAWQKLDHYWQGGPSKKKIIIKKIIHQKKLNHQKEI